VYSSNLTPFTVLSSPLLRFENSNCNQNSASNLIASTWYSKKVQKFEDLTLAEQSALNATNSFLPSVHRNLATKIGGNYSDMQIGLVLDDGTELRFPAADMQRLFSCYNSTYDPLKTRSFELRKQKEISITYECGMFYISVNFTYGTVNCYMPAGLLNSILLTGVPTDSYEESEIYFIAPSDVSYVVFQSTTANYSVGLCESLFVSDPKLITECHKSTNLTITNAVNSTIEGYNSLILAAYAPVIIDASVITYGVSDNSSYIAGCLAYKQIVLQSWNKVIDDILDVLVIQLAIFMIFIIISIYLSWKLSAVITQRIKTPINVIGKILKGKASKEEMKKQYNKEVNKVISDLKLLNTLEKFIDPHFLNHPHCATRIANLSMSYKLFRKTKNNRGMAISKNLMGNTYFSMKDYQRAEECYRSALEHTEALQALVLKHESKQQKLITSEIKLEKYIEKHKRHWNENKRFLQENIIERKQQLCKALEAKIIMESDEHQQVSRTELKTVHTLQLEILEYYVSTKTHYIRLIKVLLDMAKSFQYLQYYHSGLQLLDIVRDELSKLNTDKILEGDIDITRFKSIGINIKYHEGVSSARHFTIENLVFEKDILMQCMFYRRGLILLECDKPQEAGHAFTYAIVFDR
jgi:hypothetical protein